MGIKCPGIRGQFSAFPSKGNETEKDQVDHGTYNKADPDTLCNDGDQTTYNGMLCASGVKNGCDAVAQAQDADGRWFRSPHRRWMWKARCKDLRGRLYNDRCAYGFSADMNLGVLLYTLKTRDLTRYTEWLQWLDTNAATTKLCKQNGDEFTDCISVEWPRVCTDDLGHLNPGEDPGISIDGRYGGKCVLRPPDALDFAAVNDATATAPPSRMSNWEVKSRLLMRAAQSILPGIVPGIAAVPPLVLMSTVDPAHFPLHLDAVRVLLRIMILSPSLKQNNLPTLPNICDLVPARLVRIESGATTYLTQHLHLPQTMFKGYTP